MKQVIVLRKDLNMRKGKMVAQGAHASMAVFFNRMEEMKIMSQNETLFFFEVPKVIREWMTGKFTKICVSVNSEEELLGIFNQVETLDIPCSLIKDSGDTEFHGVPTYTAVAVGPWHSDIIDKITGHLKLL